MRQIVYLFFPLFILFSFNINAQNDNTENVSIQVSGVCGSCESRIEEAALKVSGVKEASWDAEEQRLFVVTLNNEFDINNLHNAVANVGHDTDLLKSNDETYNDLPGCCKYRPNDEEKVACHPDEDKIEGTSGDVENSEVKGIVYERADNGELVPLLGANLMWEGTTNGTSTDKDGSFTLDNTDDYHYIIVSYVGYKTDTFHLDHDQVGNDLEIILSNSIDLDAVEINYRKRTTEFSRLDPIKVHKIGEEELQKAACCNLSESFTTNSSIDVSFTDAVTGVRKIEMLGLAGKYVQITRESMPDIRGLSSISGLSYTPGHWIEGIQLNLGTGSVANGFESITGQINVELRKPEESDPFYLNLYGNMEGRMEANLNLSHILSDNLSTGLLLHGNMKNSKSDNNNDGFLDKPIGNQFIALNRWKIIANNGIRAQFGIKGMIQDNTSGQLDFDKENNQQHLWGAILDNKRLESWVKIGKIFPDNPYASLGFQLSGVLYDQKNKFGNRNFDAAQQSLYANLIYQSIFNNTNHQFRTGLSYQLDKMDEEVNSINYTRNESVPGAFFEYTFIPDEKFTLVGGLRGDLHNNYGFFYTPRLNLKYAFSDNTIFRVAAGKGLRTANVFAENIGYFASSRVFSIAKEDSNSPYGLDPEVAWNFGGNIVQQVNVFDNEFVFSFDGYHTRFENQIVVDLENPREVSFYNLDGKSYSNNIQAQVDFSVFENLDFRLAYRFNDVKVDFKNDGLLQKPLSSKHRAFINIGYQTANKWKFDWTLNWQGKKRIPNTLSNPEQYRLDTYSPNFYSMNAQVSKEWNDVFELYIGSENILNYKQENAIIEAENPFGQYFDSSLIWGPVFGRNIYFGLRYRIKR